MRSVVAVVLILLLLGCENIFTTSALSGLKSDPEDMSSSELSAYANDVLSDPDATDEEIAEVVALLLENRISPTEEELRSDPDIRDQYIDETLQLAALVQKQADVEDLLINLTTDNDSDNLLGSILDDQERVDNLSSASSLIAQAYSAEQLGGVTESSIEPTQLVLGGAGLISDILQDETKSAALDAAPDLETSTLEGAGFTATEINNIQTSNSMIEAAKSSGGLSSEITDVITEGLPF